MLLDDVFGGSFGVCRVDFRYACGVPGPFAWPPVMRLSALPKFGLARVSQIKIALSRPPVAKHVGSVRRNATVFTERVWPSNVRICSKLLSRNCHRLVV